MLGDGCEEIVFASVEQRAIRGRARRYDAHNFSADKFLARAGQLHLIANRNLESGADQPRDVTFGGVVRNAAHRNGLALFAIPRSERDLQFSRGYDRVFIKKFVEIAQAKEQQRMRVARLDGVILLHQRCCRLAHSLIPKCVKKKA